jgi:HK97 family phage prohead protease
MEKITKLFETKQQDGWWIASTRDFDRDSDVVDPLGLDITNYRLNPVMVWAHDYQSPFAVIGRAAEMEVTGNEFKVRPEWREPVNDSDPMHIIRSLIDSGLVRALSIGFRPLEWKDNEKGGRTFSKAEILEISAVPIPANQAALRLAFKSLQDSDAEAIAERVAELLKQREPVTAITDNDIADADDESKADTPEVGEEPTAEDATLDEEALLTAIENYLASANGALGGLTNE